VPEPYTVQARENEETSLLSITKAAFTDVMANYREQNDIIMTNLLLQYGLTRDGEDTAGGSATMKQKDDEGQIKMREGIKVRTNMHHRALIMPIVSRVRMMQV
jgi:hypothetical protein